MPLVTNVINSVIEMMADRLWQHEEVVKGVKVEPLAVVKGVEFYTGPIW